MSTSDCKRPGLTYDERLAADIGRRPQSAHPQVAAARDFFYVPGEILLSNAAEDILQSLLFRLGGRPDEERHEHHRRYDLDLRRWLFPEADVLPILRILDAHLERDPDLLIGPNHVHRGTPRYIGGPSGPPFLHAEPLGLEQTPPDEDVDIEVLDTGLWSGWPTQSLLAGGVVELGPDRDVLDIDGSGLLDTEAGHGTFIAGLIAQAAPQLRVGSTQVLDPVGLGSEADIALALAASTAPVLSLSFGAYSWRDRPPALGQGLAALGGDRVVVAAAGNNHSSRPFWPAAFTHVIAVGALAGKECEGAVAAGFSNFGEWVDVWAPGVDLVSTYPHGHWVSAEEDVEFVGGARWSGTSFAAPLVAAAVAQAFADAVASGLGATARAAAYVLLGALPYEPGLGLVYTPPVDLSA
jgi:hypothetical protein